jgi:hypothetical protein
MKTSPLRRAFSYGNSLIQRDYLVTDNRSSLQTIMTFLIIWFLSGIAVPVYYLIQDRKAYGTAITWLDVIFALICGCAGVLALVFWIVFALDGHGWFSWIGAPILKERSPK